MREEFKIFFKSNLSIKEKPHFMKFRYMLAPMNDITGPAFRTLCHQLGADLTFTEMARIEGLSRKNENTIYKIRWPDETPAEIQLLGSDKTLLEKFLKDFEPQKGFSGFNLNCGCPDPQPFSLGYGCALMRKPEMINALCRCVKNQGFPISVKMRLGITEMDLQKKIYLNIINKVDADYFIVHARTRIQSYAEPADFSVYPECAATGKVIIANGDIKDKKQIALLKDSGVVGAMIGRAAVLDPNVFARLKGLPEKPKPETEKEYIRLSDKYQEPFRYRKNILSRMFIQ
jgi:tRNA-dihydrouridine synthase B